MNMKYICAISILVIVMIGLGCVDKPENISPENTTTKVDTPITTSVPNIVETPGNIPKIVTQENVTVADVPGNTSVPEETNMSGNTSAPEETNISDNTSVLDTSVTKIFKIGDENNMLGINVRLVNITDYDNDTAIINVDGVDYEYNQELNTTIQVKGREIFDLISSEDDKTAEITVDYV